MPFDPIPPVPGRVWPPEHCWMDESGAWWEAPGKRLTIEDNIFVVGSPDTPLVITGNQIEVFATLDPEQRARDPDEGLPTAEDVCGIIPRS